MPAYPAVYERGSVHAWNAPHQALVGHPKDHCFELGGGRACRYRQGRRRGYGPDGHCPGLGIHGVP
eukprot:10940194-Lingulodinium_polyedra.AAC.1